MLGFNVVPRFPRRGVTGVKTELENLLFRCDDVFGLLSLVLKMCGESIRHGRVDVRGAERQNWRALGAGLRGFLLASALGFCVSRYSCRRSI